MKKQITQDPNILGGKPIITGTRMSVEAILELLSSGLEIDDVLKEYPFLKREQVIASIDYAKNILTKEESYIFDKIRSSKNT